MTEAVAHDLDPADGSPVVARGLVKSFLAPDGSSVAAVDGIDFEAPQGKISAIVGPSGSGKTTLLQLLAGLDRPDGWATTWRAHRRKTGRA